MPPVRLVPNVPHESDADTLEVAPGLPPGEYRIRLEVINDRQVRSKPAQAIITVLPR